MPLAPLLLIKLRKKICDQHDGELPTSFTALHPASPWPR
jgi:hypothetical protein